jgi:hypothetical protein
MSSSLQVFKFSRADNSAQCGKIALRAIVYGDDNCALVGLSREVNV